MSQNISESAKNAAQKIEHIIRPNLFLANRAEPETIIQTAIDTEVAKAVAERDKRIAELTASNEKMLEALKETVETLIMRCKFGAVDGSEEGDEFVSDAIEKGQKALAPAPKEAE